MRNQTITTLRGQWVNNAINCLAKRSLLARDTAIFLNNANTVNMSIFIGKFVIFYT